MNKDRRYTISMILKKMNSIKDELENVKNEEEFAFDNMPENLQGSMRGEESQEAIETMDEALDSLEEAISQLENI